MHNLHFVTGNEIKFRLADTVCRRFNVNLEQVALDIPEMQADDGEPVARDKALRAFELLQKPVVVTDDSWIIPGLNGFPGPYMKFMNNWFTPEDWLRLTGSLEDRRIILRQIAVYQDADQQKVFTVDIEGLLLDEIRGQSKYSHNTIFSMDNGEHSDAELDMLGKTGSDHRKTVWHEVAAWIQEQHRP